MRRFVHEQHPARVVFGAGSFEALPAEIEALGCARVLVIAGGSALAAGRRLAGALGARAAAHLDRVAQHVPAELVAEARALATSVAADGLCSIGGGSATGLAKAVAAELALPIVAVPTTYAGSEATTVYGVTAGAGEGPGRGRKRTARDPRVAPRVVVYDPALTTGLPAGVTAASGLNAIAQAVPALRDPEADPLAALHAGEAVRVLARALPVAVAAPGDLDARSQLLYGAYLAGSALAATGTSLHHRLCHLLGGRYGLVHADVHAALLPYTLARDEQFLPAGRARIAGALGAREAAAGLGALARAVGAPACLAAVGVPGGDLDELARQAAAAAGDHPRAGDAAWFGGLLADAHAGRPPEPAGEGGPTDRSEATDEEARR